MTRIDFYQLKKQSFEDVLPKLLQKAYATGKRIILKTTTDKVEEINTFLWTYNEDSFLPHGSRKDGFAEQQPIWITDNEDNPNNAVFLFLTCNVGYECDKLAEYERIFNIFDGNDEASLNNARSMWKTYKNLGFDVYYWEQSANGIWEQKT